MLEGVKYIDGSSRKIPFLGHENEYAWFLFISMSMLDSGT